MGRGCKAQGHPVAAVVVVVVVVVVLVVAGPRWWWRARSGGRAACARCRGAHASRPLPPPPAPLDPPTHPHPTHPPTRPHPTRPAHTQVPCDPKLLLPPFNAKELTAFQLTELEKGSARDAALVLEPDLGIAIHPWNIEQYSVPEHPPPLHPADAALAAEDQATTGAGGGRAAAEVSWLLRTKYISVGGRGGQEGRRPGSRQVKAEDEGEVGAEGVQGREAQLARIERGFEASARPPVHHADPTLTPLEVLPGEQEGVRAHRTRALNARTHPAQPAPLHPSTHPPARPPLSRSLPG